VLAAPHAAPVASATAASDASLVNPFARQQSEKVKWAAIAAGAVLVVIAVIYLLVPGTGTLVVSVAGPGNKAVEKVKVFIDDKEVCSESPCIAGELETGTHIVKVVADGYGSTAGKAYSVEAGTETPVNITLAAPSPGTGIHAKHEGSGLKLWVDGKEIGPLPQELKEMSPGSHKIRIGGSDRYEEYEETINVEADKIASVEPKLKVLKGEATLEPGDNADGAKIMLVSGKERRPLNKDLPVRLEVGTDKRYKIVATKEGYETYENFIEFDDGKAEKTFIISLKEATDDAEEADDEHVATAAPPRPVAPAGRSQAAPVARRATAAPVGKGTLNINSIPVSNVILDGVPKGNTPVIGVKVNPGTHTVVFMHPTHGRKVRAVTVQAGKSATAAVRFP
jgi:serine/threonine-protein kinase